MSKTGASADFSTGMGEKNLTSSSKFFNDILSGDSSKQSQALAPEIGTAKTSAAQTNKTKAEFGTRSGGTAASTAATNDKVHSDITGMVGNLTGTAANSLASSGSSLISQGMQGYKQQADLSQEQLQNWQNSIFGKGMSDMATTAENAGEGAMDL
jgi:hypothetical protein